MSKVVKIRIKNFRKFKCFDAVFGERNVICLVGRGDSGKSSLLDAISYCFSPSWNIPISDYDFYNCNVSEPIEICAVVTEFPKELSGSDKFGMYYSGWNPTQQKVVEATEEGAIPALQILLRIDDSLEPQWEVLNSTSNLRVPISARDRARFKVHVISDYVSNHFAWANGSPLNSLSHATDESLDVGSLLSVMRKIRASSKEIQFGDFTQLLSEIERQAGALGLNSGKIAPAFDMKRLAVKEGAVCLHDSHDLPLRLLGKGSRRLMSIAVQSAVSNGQGVILIDEIEQGLEPDRICNLVHALGKNVSNQVFFTTHSGEALVEMEAENVCWLKGSESAHFLYKDVQGLVRKNPAAFFAKRVVLCEGQTECGFVRALDDFFHEKGYPSLAEIGVVIADGGGSKFAVYAKQFVELGMPFLLFCDSDEKAANAKKAAIGQQGVCIVDWEGNDAFEQGIYKGVPDEGILQLNRLAVRLKCNSGMSEEQGRQAVLQQIGNADKTITAEAVFADKASFPQELRKTLGKVAKGNKDSKNAWFKSVTGGMDVGTIVCERYEQLFPDGRVKQNIDKIRDWLFGV